MLVCYKLERFCCQIYMVKSNMRKDDFSLPKVFNF